MGCYGTREEANAAARMALYEFPDRDVVGWDKVEEIFDVYDGCIEIRTNGGESDKIHIHIKKEKKRRERAGKRWAPPPPAPTVIREVFIVKVEFRENVGSDEGDLQRVEVLGVFKDLEAANEFARKERSFAESFAEDKKEKGCWECEEFEENGRIQIALLDCLDGEECRISVSAQALL